MVRKLLSQLCVSIVNIKTNKKGGRGREAQRGAEKWLTDKNVF